MNIGDIKRIKSNQSCTCGEARGQLCIIEEIADSEEITIRFQKEDGTHLHQWVFPNHLEDV